MLTEHQEEDKRVEVNKQVVENVGELLLEELPHNSPYCAFLLHFVMKGLPCSSTLDLFNISASSYQHTCTLINHPPLLNTKYKPKVKRKMVCEERLTIAIAIFHN